MGLVGDETVARVHVPRRHVGGEQHGGQERRREALAVGGDLIAQRGLVFRLCGDPLEQVRDLGARARQHGPDPLGAFRTGQATGDLGMPLEQGIELWQHQLRIAACGSVGRREQRVGPSGERRYDHDGPGAALRVVDHASHPLQCRGVRDRCAAELEDRGIGATGRWCCRLTHRLTSGEPSSASGKRRAALYG